MKNYTVWSEIGLGFGEPVGTSSPRIPRSIPPPPPARCPVVLPISKQTSSVILLLLYNICANYPVGIVVKRHFHLLFIYSAYFPFSTVFLFFFFTVEALLSNLLGNSKKSWSLARMSSRKRYKTIEGGLLQELTRASETHYCAFHKHANSNCVFRSRQS